jgi:hypothetical protein
VCFGAARGRSRAVASRRVGVDRELPFNTPCSSRVATLHCFATLKWQAGGWESGASVSYAVLWVPTLLCNICNIKMASRRVEVDRELPFHTRCSGLQHCFATLKPAGGSRELPLPARGLVESFEMGPRWRGRRCCS